MPIHRAGWPIIAVVAAVMLLVAYYVPALAWPAFLVIAWSIYFFRDPPRVTPMREGVLVSPADGRILMIEPAVPPPELMMDSTKRLRISIFLNVFNVHVNRVPCDGEIVKAAYHAGQFLNASLDKASDLNERAAVRLRLEDGREVAFVQIAGLVARRIVTTLQDGQSVRAGERYGLIRFGSRMDVYLPAGVEPLVQVGQTMVGGETVLADLSQSTLSGTVV